MIGRTLKGFYVALFIAISALTLGGSNSASAIIMTISGSCYFSGGTCSLQTPLSCPGNDVFSDPVTGRQSCGSGYAMDRVYDQTITDALRKARFIDYIINKYNCVGMTVPSSMCSQNQAGAAMVMHSFTGTSPSKTVSTTIINDFKSRLNQASVTVTAPSANKLVCSSSFWTGSDIFWHNYWDSTGADTCESRQVILVQNSGNIMGTFERTCGNPSARLITIPMAVVTPTTSVDKSTAMPGDTVTWTHKVTVTSGGPTTYDMQYYYIRSNGWSGNDVNAPHTLGSGAATGASSSYPVPYTVSAGDAGKTLCSATIVAPSSGSTPLLGVGQSSAPACVTIGGGAPVVSVCRPIKTPINAFTYKAMDNGLSGAQRVYSSDYTPTYYAKTDVYNDSTIYTGTQTWQTIPLTTLNTDGEKHNIALTDTTNHIIGMSPRYATYYDRIDVQTRSWVTTATTTTGSYSTTDPTAPADTADTTYTIAYFGNYFGSDWYTVSWTTTTYSSGWSAWSPAPSIPVGSYTAPSVPANTDSTQYTLVSYPVYQDTTVTYSDGDTRVIVSGLAPSSTTSSGAIRTPADPSPKTIGPCFDYILNVSLSSFGANLEAGATITVNTSATSNPFTLPSAFQSTYQTHSKSKNTQWVISQLVIDPGVPLPSSTSGGISNSSPCDYYDPTNLSTCTVNNQGTTVFSTSGTPSSGIATSPSPYTVPDVLAGTKICFTFSVLPDRSDPSNESTVPDSQYWNHAAFDPSSNCILVVKKPKVQIWGGDLIVGKTYVGGGSVSSSVDTSQSVKSGTTFGSWIEYGIFASGTISGAGSGSSLAGGRPGSTTCQLAPLTFANTGSGKISCDGSTLGSYSFGTNIRDIGSYFSATSTLSSTSLTINDSLSGVYGSSASAVNITGGTTSKSIVLDMPNTDVTISGDIHYSNNTVTSISQIPQLVIIARNIYIDGSVSNIDAWLVATSGKVNTCTEGGERTPLTVFTCDNLLVINGPVVANKLYLRRTAGSNPANESGDPAEIINLRSDAYLWMYARTLGDNRIRSTFVTELPPRL